MKEIVYVLMKVLFLEFISLVFRNWTNKHRSNNLVSAEMVCHSSPHITAKSLIQGAPKSQILNVSCLVLQLSFSDPLKAGIKSRMKM